METIDNSLVGPKEIGGKRVVFFLKNMEQTSCKLFNVEIILFDLVKNRTDIFRDKNNNSLGYLNDANIIDQVFGKGISPLTVLESKI